MQTSLAVGVFFELLWLDLIPAGTFIPPNMCLATIATLALAHFLGAARAGDMVLPLLFAIPVALLGAKLEYLQRRWQDKGYNELLHWSRQSRPRTRYALERIIGRSLGQLFVANGVFFIMAMLVLAPTARLVDKWYGPAFTQLGLQWGHLWLLAGIGGIISLRLRRSYILLAAAVTVVAGAHLFIMG